MRRLLVFWLLGSLLMPFFLHGFWSQIRLGIDRYHARKAMRAGIPEEEKVKLTFCLDEIHKLEWKHSLEFGYLGEMYDILATDTIGDSIRYICFHDVDESLTREMIKWIAKRTSDDTSPFSIPGSLWQHFFSTIFYTDFFGIEKKMVFPAKHKADTIYLRSLDDITRVPQVPPPRCSISAQIV